MFNIALMPATKVVSGAAQADAIIWVPEAGQPKGWSCTPEKIIPKRTEMNIVTAEMTLRVERPARVRGRETKSTQIGVVQMK